MFENKQRRLPDWDYSSPGHYFITINTKHRECILGNVENDVLILSDIGKIVKEEWEKSFEIRKELSCDCYIIMPNHIHAILQIHQSSPTPAGTNGRSYLRGLGMIPKSISSFVAGFKSSATTRINEFRNSPYLPVWQSRFYDHIIRDDEDLNRVREYIIYNPLKWNIDDDNPVNIKKEVKK